MGPTLHLWAHPKSRAHPGTVMRERGAEGWGWAPVVLFGYVPSLSLSPDTVMAWRGTEGSRVRMGGAGRCRRGTSVSWNWDQRDSRAQEDTPQAPTRGHEPEELLGPDAALPS